MGKSCNSRNITIPIFQKLTSLGVTPIFPSDDLKVTECTYGLKNALTQTDTFLLLVVFKIMSIYAANNTIEW